MFASRGHVRPKFRRKRITSRLIPRPTGKPYTNTILSGISSRWARQSVQTKLAVSPPDLLSEQEADKIAIVSMRLAETQTLRDFTNDGERDVKAVASGASTSGVLGTNMRLPVSRAMHTRKKRTQWPIWWFRA